MARNIEDIQRDIERTRRNLAGTLDELAHRSQPKNLVEGARKEATNKLQDPTVQKVLAGAAALVVGLIAFSTFRSRKRSKEIKQIQKLLAAR